MKPILIGLGYQIRSGKDTVAQMIIEAAKAVGLRAVRRAFADPLKEECAMVAYREFPELGKSYEQILAEMYSDDPAVKEPWRLLMQWWGDMRRQGCEDYWLRCFKEWYGRRYFKQGFEGTFNTLEDSHFIIVPDMRHVNEARFIQASGGLAIKIERPGLKNNDKHISENALTTFTGWNAIIRNDKGLDELKAQVQTHFTYMTMWAGIHETGDTSRKNLSAKPGE